MPYFKNYPVPARLHMEPSPFSTGNPCFNKYKPGTGGALYDSGTRLGSNYWTPMHGGTDCYGANGDNIYPCMGGTVYAVDDVWGRDYGRHQVLIRHVIDQTSGPDLIRFSFYAHMSARYCNEGEKVTEHFHIGELDSSGYTTGPHLHFAWQASPKFKQQVIDAGAKHLPEIISWLRAA